MDRFKDRTCLQETLGTTTKGEQFRISDETGENGDERGDRGGGRAGGWVQMRSPATAYAEWTGKGGARQGRRRRRATNLNSVDKKKH